MLMLDDVGVSYQIVLTKIDKLGAGELALTAKRTGTEMVAHTAAHPEIHMTSALKRRGIAELRATLGSFAASPALSSLVASPMRPQ